jgi:hypothetical protein
VVEHGTVIDCIEASAVEANMDRLNTYLSV